MDRRYFSLEISELMKLYILFFWKISYYLLIKNAKPVFAEVNRNFLLDFEDMKSTSIGNLLQGEISPDIGALVNLTLLRLERSQ